MKIGFTGSREGTRSREQHEALARWLAAHLAVNPASEFHHGCCVGADAEATALADVSKPRPAIHGHRSTLAGMEDAEAVAACDVLYREKPPLDRNRDIVNACDVLLACPKGPEEMRSGTWATIRYAFKRRKPTVIFWPDGTVTDSGREVSG